MYKEASVGLIEIPIEKVTLENVLCLNFLNSVNNEALNSEVVHVPQHLSPVPSLNVSLVNEAGNLNCSFKDQILPNVYEKMNPNIYEKLAPVGHSYSPIVLSSDLMVNKLIDSSDLILHYLANVNKRYIEANPLHFS